MSQAKDNMRLLIEPTAEKATQLVATIFRTTLCERAAQSQPCRVALAGGTTPHALYQTLARYGSELGEPWQWLEIFFGDERTVPHDHIESNYHMVQRALLDHVPINLERVHPMPADADDLDTAAAICTSETSTPPLISPGRIQPMVLKTGFMAMRTGYLNKSRASDSPFERAVVT